MSFQASAPTSPPGQPLIFVLQFAVALGFWIFSPLIEFIRTEFHLSAAQIGLIPLAADGAGLLAAPLLGWAVDRVAPRPAVAAMFGGFGIGLIVAGSARTYPVVLLGVAVLGTLFVIMGPLTNRMLSEAVDPRHYGFAYSVKQAGVSLAMATGLFLAPVVAGQWGWRGAYLAVGALTIVAGTVLVAVLPGSVPGPPRARTWPVAGFVQQVRSAWNRPSMRVLFVIGFGFQGIQLVFMTFVIPFLVDVHGFTVASAAIVLAVIQLGAFAARPALGWWSDLRPERRSRFLGVLGIAVGAAILAATVGSGKPFLAVVIVLAGLCGFSWVGVYFACLADVSPKGEIGFATGMSLVPIKVGGMVLPVALGIVIDQVCYRAAFGGFGALLLAGFLIVLAIGRGQFGTQPRPLTTTED